MEIIEELLVSLVGFLIIALSAREIGASFGRFRLPLISGFLVAGIVAGPSVLELIPRAALDRLGFIGDAALAFIALAAGSELHIEAFRDRLRSIAAVTAGLVVVTLAAGTLAVVLLSPWIPALSGLAIEARVGAALVAGSILVARSPSSAMAIVSELRARGPFTRTALGVTVVMDAIVIVLFALSSELAEAFGAGEGFSASFAPWLAVELSLALASGVIVARLLVAVLSSRAWRPLKTAAVLLIGYGVFASTHALREASGEGWTMELFVEPLLVCMVAGFVVSNASRSRGELALVLEETSPAVYLAFFTLAGADLAIDVLLEAWPVALALFGCRLLSIFVGSLAGSSLAGDPPLHRRVSWMAFVTQAGVGIGLASEAASEFPSWGPQLAAVLVAAIVLNQLVGPPLFKWAIARVGEAHPPRSPEDTHRDVLVFGAGGGQSRALARRLASRGWSVRLLEQRDPREGPRTEREVETIPVEAITEESLRAIGAERADAVVALLPDPENLALCRLLRDRFDVDTLVVRLQDHANLAEFDRLGARVVDPGTAVVSLLEHFVLSPSSTSLLLGLDAEDDLLEVEVGNPALDGLAVRELHLPPDTLVLSIHREGHTLHSTGHTRIRVGDRVTVIGPRETLERSALILEE